MDGSRELRRSVLIVALLGIALRASDGDPEAAPGVDLVHEWLDAAEAHGKAGRLEEAANSLAEAVVAVEQVDHRFSRAIHYLKIGRVYGRIPAQRQRAEECLETAHELSEDLDAPARSSILHRLGTITRYNSPRRAVVYFEEARSVDSKAGDRRGEAKALEGLGLAYRNLGLLVPHKSC